MSTKSGYVSPNLTFFGLKMAIKIPLCKRWRYQCGCWFIGMKCCKVYCMQVKFFVGLYHGSNVGGRTSHITLSFQQCITPWIDLQCKPQAWPGPNDSPIGKLLGQKLVEQIEPFWLNVFPKSLFVPQEPFWFIAFPMTRWQGTAIGNAVNQKDSS